MIAHQHEPDFLLGKTDAIPVYVCSSGRSFSSKLSEIHEAIKAECTPIIACFDVGSESNKDHYFKAVRQPKFHPSAQAESPLPSPTILRREITFSSESDESYGLQLLSRIASDLQVEEGAKVIIPVAIVQPKRNSSIDETAGEHTRFASITRSPYGNETTPATVEDKSDVIDPQMMLQCLDAGALDVVKSPLDKAGIMGLTVHAYRVYKKAKKEQAGFMALAKRGRKQSWVGVDEEKPYAYLREAMVKKLLKGICEPETVIEDYQHRGLNVDLRRREVIAEEVGSWGFCGHDFDEDELVYAGYCMLQHALKSAELEHWRMSEGEFIISLLLSDLTACSGFAAFYARLSCCV
jgi:3',5'-cyclic-nucleotide phosphodiesterase